MMKEINVRVEVPAGKMDEYRQRREWEAKVKEAKDAVKAYLESTGEPIVNSVYSATPYNICWVSGPKLMCIFIADKIIVNVIDYNEYALVSKHEDGTLIPELMEAHRSVLEMVIQYGNSLEERIKTLEKEG